MSQTYCLVCLECKEYLWIGQGGYDMRSLYSAKEYIEALKLFFNKHVYHELRFSEDDIVCDTDVVEVVLNKEGTDLELEEDLDGYVDNSLSELTRGYYEEWRVCHKDTFERLQKEVDKLNKEE